MVTHREFLEGMPPFSNEEEYTAFFRRMLDRYPILEIILYHKLVGAIYDVRFVYADCVFESDLAFMNELREGWRAHRIESVW